MSKGLVIAEKPSLMRDINEAFNRMDEDLGFDLDFTALRGHFIELKMPGEYKEEWEVWNVDELPMIPDKFEFKVKPGVKSDYKALKQKLDSGQYDFVVNACDAGREGQAIFWAFYNHTKCQLPVKRIWVNDTTMPAFQKGLKNLLDESTNDMLINLKDASFYRMYLDWMLGMNLSRAISLKTNATIPVGRVMTPTLNIVVERDLEIENFVPKTTYEIDANFEDKYTGTWFEMVDNEANDGKVMNFRFDEKSKAEKLINSLGKDGVVKDVTKKEEREFAPPNYSLTDLQRDANEVYGFTVDKTLDLAQSLYETHKILTYPRTESKALSSLLGKELEDYLGAISDIPEVKDEVSNILSDTSKIDAVRNSKKYIDDSKLTDHHAIIPTKKKPSLSALSEDERKLYLLVVKRFVAIFLEPYRQSRTTIITEINDETFRTTGVTLVDNGYKRLYNYQRENQNLPDVSKGDIFKVKEFKINEKISTPPPYYNDSTLVGAMQLAGRFVDEEELKDTLRDVEGIGTVATRASIITKLIDDELIYRDKRLIKATDFGKKVISVLNGRDIVSPSLTADWEGKLRQLENGELHKDKFYNEMIEYVKMQTNDILENVTTQLGSKNKFESIGSCPICGKDIIMTKKFYLCEDYNGQDGDGCKFVLGQKVNGGSISKTNAIKIISGEPTNKIKFKSKEGKTYETKLIFNKDNNKIEFYKDVIAKCPICGKDVTELYNFFSCDGYFDKSCNFSISKTILSAKITTSDLKALVEGKVVGPKTFTWSNGKQGEASIKYNTNTQKIDFEFENTYNPDGTVIGNCPKCNEKALDMGSFVKCSSETCDMTVSKRILGAKLTDDDIQKFLNKKPTSVKNIRWSNGNKDKKRIQFDSKKGIRFID